MDANDLAQHQMGCQARQHDVQQPGHCQWQGIYRHEHYTEYDSNRDGGIADFEETMHRSCSTAVIKDGLVFLPDFSGLLHCLDAKTGRVHWTHDLFSAIWGSPLVVEGKVYLGDEEGKVTIFDLSPQKEILGEIQMRGAIYSTPVVANNVLYVATRTHLFAIQEHRPQLEQPQRP